MPVFPKLATILIQILEDFVDKYDVDFYRFLKTYDLPLHYDYAPDPAGMELSAEDYVDCVVQDDDEGLFPLIELLFAEYQGSNPVFFRMLRGVHVSPLPRLTRQLEIEGYTIISGKVRPMDAEAPQEYQDRTALAASLRTHQEIHPDILIHHIEASDESMMNSVWHAATGEARAFFEGLVVNIAESRAESPSNIPNYPRQGERRSKFAPCREYLVQIGFINQDENELIKQLYSFASIRGGHPGITEEQEAKLIRRLCWVVGTFIIAKYVDWKAHGYRWPA
ncbi:MAG: hypothetical protein O7D91_08015 [Planctomycetota bacterium]|nr:hypothetical protein [Planctomycetota bacterium]